MLNWRNVARSGSDRFSQPITATWYLPSCTSWKNAGNSTVFVVDAMPTLWNSLCRTWMSCLRSGSSEWVRTVRLNGCPSLLRIPSDPAFQPAASSSCLAVSGL